MSNHQARGLSRQRKNWHVPALPDEIVVQYVFKAARRFINHTCRGELKDEIGFMGKMDWTGGTPIVLRESGVHNGYWYPAIEVYSEEDGPHGIAHQKFILHDGFPSHRFPVDYVGPKLDLSDPQVLIDQWRRLKRDGD